MSGFKFKAHTPTGKVHTGVIQATTVEEVARTLARQKLIPDSIVPEPLDRSLKLRWTPSPVAMVQFSRQFATLVESAIPLLLSLEILVGLTDDRPLRKATARVAADVAEGSTLADAMRRHPKVFSDIFVNIVAAGEEGGTLDDSLNRLADYLERSLAVRQKVQAAMFYPVVILLVAVGSVAALLTLVVPTFEGMFSASGMDLPFATQVLVETSNFVGSNVAFIIAGLLFAFLVGNAIHGTRRGRYVLHRVLLATPVFGRLTQKIAVARLCRTIGSLLASGVSILEALVAGARTSGNAVMEEAVLRARDSVAMGSTVAEALAMNSVLPSLVPRMVGVGEQTGRLSAMLSKVADFYEREVDTEVDGLLKALEPALVVCVGVVLGGIVVAMYLPIFDAIGAVDAVPR